MTPGAPPPSAPRFEPRQKRMRSRYTGYGDSQSAVRLAFPTGGFRARGYRALEVMMRVLDDGMSTRLHRRICDERGLAYEVSASLESFEDAGLFDVAASVARPSLIPLVSEVLTILSDLAVAGPTRSEVEKAHRRYAFDLGAMSDDAQALCDFYGPAELFNLRPAVPELRLDLLGQTATDVRRAARQLVRPSRLNLAIVGADDAATRREISAVVRRWREGHDRASTRSHMVPRTTPITPTLGPVAPRERLDRTRATP